MYKLCKIIAITTLVFTYHSFFYALVICTAANSIYFPHALNLIGSIHKNNFDELQEIMVFNLGLSNYEVKRLNSIQKVKVYEVEKTHKSILDFFVAPSGYRSLGWFAWKPVVIKQALDIYESVLWLDAGNTVLKSLVPIFDHINNEGYFMCTIGDELLNNQFKHPLSWGTTRFVIEKYELDSPENEWILDQEFIEGGMFGCSRSSDIYKIFLMPLYECTFDMRNFQDDGTCPGLGRHDQTLMSILVYKNNLKFFKQDYKQKKSMLLAGHDIYTTWNSVYVNKKTTIYRSRNDLFKVDRFERFLKYI